MHKLLDTSTAAVPTGISPQRKLLKLRYGAYAGRLVCLYNESASDIAMMWADPPYVIWSAPTLIVTDSADYPLSVCHDDDSNLYLIYVQQTSLDVIFIKMIFTAGLWASGSPVTVLSAGSSYYPVIARSEAGELWCAYAYYDAGQYTIRVKSSPDGLIWGNGPSDTGTALSGQTPDMPFVNLTFRGSGLCAVYSFNRSSLYLRNRDSISGDWEPGISLLNSDYIDSEFDCAISSDRKLGIASCPTEAGKVYFREFDGVNLTGLDEAALESGRSPQVIYKGTRPYILYAADSANGMFLPKYAYKDGESFVRGDLIAGLGFFDKVLLYNQASQSYEDKSIEAASASAADVYHTVSSALVANVGDCVYTGKSSRFFCAAIILSTAANGGAVVWEYYNGQSWVIFTPQSGAYNFDAASKTVLFWNDVESAPAAWQITAVDGQTAFWIRARVTGAFTTAPVGTQVAAIPGADYLAAAREA